MNTTLPFRAILRVRLLTMSLNRRQFRKLLFRKLRLGKLPLRKMGRKSPMTMFLRSIALRKLNIGRLPTDMLKTVMHRVDMHRVDMHRMCKRKMRNSHLTHISREPICSTAQCTVTTAMFPTAPMRQIRDSRVMHRRSSSMRSMPSRADMWLIPHRAGEFLPCRIYLRKR